MNKRNRILLAALPVAFLAWFAWQMLRPREPVYQGKPLSTWLKEMERWDGDTNYAAFVAFREMGTNAIPALMKIIESGGPPVQRMIVDLNRKQSFVDFPFGEPWHQTGAAAYALYAMGAKARPALPALTNLLFHTNGLFVCTIALAGIGSEALPSLIAALTNQNQRIRLSVTSGLGWERSDSNIVVPALIARLKDSDRLVHIAAVHALGQLCAEPELAVPALAQDFPGTDSLLRAMIAIALGQYGDKAKEAVPVLLEALHDSELHDTAAWAVKRIDPEAAAKAGVSWPVQE